MQVLECFQDDNGSEQGKDVTVVLRTLGAQGYSAQQVR